VVDSHAPAGRLELVEQNEAGHGVQVLRVRQAKSRSCLSASKARRDATEGETRSPGAARSVEAGGAEATSSHLVQRLRARGSPFA